MTENLDFRFGYYNDPTDRQRLNALVREMFGGLDFSPWNELGFAFSEYTPFSFFHKGRVVANVSASRMNLTMAGREIDAVQIGTVASLPEWRGRGLIRDLIAKAHEHWAAPDRLFFLFANESVPGFYTQFGYRRVLESGFQTAAPVLVPADEQARRLDLSEPEDLTLLYRLAEAREAVSARLGVHRQSWLLLFHAAVVYPHRLYYIESLDAVVIGRANGEVFHLIDVIARKTPTLAQIWPYIGNPQCRTIEFHFTPDRMGLAEVKTEIATDSLLFVRGPLAVENESFLFPATSQA